MKLILFILALIIIIQNTFFYGFLKICHDKHLSTIYGEPKKKSLKKIYLRALSFSITYGILGNSLKKRFSIV